MKKKLKRVVSCWPLYLMMLPGLAYLFINNYMPLPGLVLAFKKYDYSLGMWKSQFVGFSNFRYLFMNQDTGIAIRNTLLYNLVFIIVGNIVAILVAVFLNDVRSKGIKKIYQTIILIPYLISMVIVSYMVYGFLSVDKGLVNSLITACGGSQIQWYLDAKYWPFILTFVSVWKSFGYNAVIYYTTILGIDPSIYEAASVDGAGKVKQFFYITLPSLKLMIITMVMLAVGRIFYSDFGLFYQVPRHSGMLHTTTTTVDTYVYDALMNLNDIGRSAAAGFLQSVLGLILILTVNTIIRKIDEENALL